MAVQDHNSYEKRYSVMSKPAGFTLIELVAAIVIIGILAAAAVPRFANLKNEALLVKLQNMQGKLQSAVNLVSSKAHAQNLNVGAQNIVIDGNTIALHSGYPVGAWIGAIRYLINKNNQANSTTSAICGVDWCGRGYTQSIPGGISTSGNGYIVKIYPKGYSYNDQCNVYYLNPANGRPPILGIQTADC